MTNQNPNDDFISRFLSVCGSTPGAVAIEELESKRTLTYGELSAEAAHIVGVLLSLGLKPESRVMVVLPNGLEFVSAALACMAEALVLIPVAPTASAREVRTLVEMSRPELVLTNVKLAAVHGSTWESRGVRVCTVDGVAAGCIDLCAQSVAPVPLSPPAAANPVSVRFHTYKGVGRPLGVEHRYRSLMQSADGLHERFSRQELGSVNLVLLPMYPVFGLVCNLVLPLSTGARIVLISSLLGVDLPALLEQKQVQMFCIVPDVARVLVDQARAARLTDPKREYAFHPELMLVSGGSYLDAEVSQAVAAELNIAPPVQGYGTTEVLPIAVQSFYETRVRGTLGRAISGATMRIRAADGSEARPGEAGELEVQTTTVCDGFVGEPQLTSESFQRGWFRTGDLARLDLEGNLSFLGRRLRFTKISGNMVDLAEIEAVTAALPGVRRACVQVRRDELGRNNLMLDVLAEPGSTIDRTRITQALRQELSRFKVPKRIQVQQEVAR